MKLDVIAIEKFYSKKKVLSSSTFSLGSGDILGILGPNGAGKSTLLAILASLIKPTSGKVLLDGSDLLSDPFYLRKIVGYVPQDIALYDELTVRDNLQFWLGKQKSRSSGKNIETIANDMKLSDVLGKKTGILSGGMKRRLNMAVALLNHPKLILLDEPLAGVDIKTQATIAAHLRHLSEQGNIIIMSSHNPEMVHSLGSKILMLDQGEQIFFGSLKDAYGLVEEQEINPLREVIDRKYHLFGKGD